MWWTLTAMAVAAAALAGCGGDDDEGAGAPDTTTTSAAAEAAARPCAEVYAEGAVIESRDELERPCDRDGELYLPGATTKDCPDGRTLFWNDLGWGYLGEPFHRHAPGAEKVAPKAERDACP